jgi:hypothetical protein
MSSAEAASWMAATLLLGGGIALWGSERVRAFIWGGGLPGRLGALPVDDVPAESAPRGWKCAQLLASPDGTTVRLAGVAIGGTYVAEDTAVCAFNREHEVPSLACECGFYAFNDREQAIDLLACAVGVGGQVVVRALLEVDLGGTVIECERGYRAEHQQVLSVGLLPWCADCAVRGELVRATVIGGLPKPPLVSARARTYAQQAAARSVHPSVRLRLSWGALRPLCGSCVETLGERALALDLVEIANHLATEVIWLDADLVPGDRVLAGHRPRPPWGG